MTTNPELEQVVQNVVQRLIGAQADDHGAAVVFRFALKFALRRGVYRFRERFRCAKLQKLGVMFHGEPAC